jgi:hypothetical protein
MANITIPKSEQTIKKEANKLKLEQLKNKKNITNDELRDLLIMLLEKS